MFKLPPHISEKYIAAEGDFQRKVAVFANLRNTDLVASANFWMQNCRAPSKYPAGDCVYDSTFWHIIVPELMRRVGEQSDTGTRYEAYGVFEDTNLVIKSLSDTKLGAIKNWLHPRVTIYADMTEGHIYDLWAVASKEHNATVNRYEVAFAGKVIK